MSTERIVASPASLPRFSWAELSAPFLDELSTRLAGLRVLEVFAGNGLLAHELSARGVDILATSLLSGHDMHERGFHHPVEETDAVSAVRRHGPSRDALLMSWPVTGEAATVAALEWGSDRPIHWIGEITRFDLGGAGLGGCASDLFHQVTEVREDIPGYVGRGRLDRAAILSVRPECVARWQAGERDPGAIAQPAGPEPAP